MSALLRLGMDLRCLPADGSSGAGIAHAARGLADAMERGAAAHGIVVCRLLAPNGFLLRRLMRAKKCDALFVPSGALSPWTGGPVFPWVHDLDIFDHPEWFPQSCLRRHLTTGLFVRGLRRSSVVFCVSQYTKRAVMRIAHVPSHRIIVTGEGVEDDMAHATRNTHDRTYALVLGTVEPRKNIPFLIALWPEVCKRFGQTVELVVAGKTGWGNVVLKGGVAWLKRIESVHDTEAEALLAHATLVLVPSLSEGFGRTALEAMAKGTPVVASNCGAIPEVVGDAGVLLDPEDREGWIRNVVGLLEDGCRRAEFGRRGRERAWDFSWEKVADRILAEIRKSW